MKRILAIVLVLLGVVGLVLGRLGETTWAPATERTASVTLQEPGPAVLLDPGLLYVGGTQGTATVTGDGDLTMITAANDDIRSYLEGTRYTRVTGLSDWATLTTETVDGEAALPEGAKDADIWRTVDTSASPVTIDIQEFATEEMETNPQPYRALLFITDGEKAGATQVDITWPVDARNEWVPYAYAGGATLAVIGLVLLVVSLSGRRREDEEALEEETVSQEESAQETGGSVFPPLGAAAAARGSETEDEADGHDEDHDIWGTSEHSETPAHEDTEDLHTRTDEIDALEEETASDTADESTSDAARTADRPRRNTHRADIDPTEENDR